MPGTIHVNMIIFSNSVPPLHVVLYVLPLQNVPYVNVTSAIAAAIVNAASTASSMPPLRHIEPSATATNTHQAYIFHLKTKLGCQKKWGMVEVARLEGPTPGVILGEG